MLKNNRIINVKSVGRRAHGRPKIGRRRPISPTDFPPIFPPESLPRPQDDRKSVAFSEISGFSAGRVYPSIEGDRKSGGARGHLATENRTVAGGVRFLSEASYRTPDARLPPEASIPPLRGTDKPAPKPGRWQGALDSYLRHRIVPRTHDYPLRHVSVPRN